MSLGKIFISHKHKDKEIARVLGDFMKEASGNRLDIYLSSDPRYQGTRAGESLPQELGKAIAQSGIVVLVYTGKSANVDWEYCIYECACAVTHGIRVVILQCSDDAPSPFLSDVRIMVADPSSIYKFTKDFMTSTNFLREQKEAITAYSPDDPDIKTKAEAFHRSLNAAIDKYLGRDPRPWSAWPTMSVRFSRDSALQIQQSKGAERESVVREQLLRHATVSKSKGVDQIFGAGVDPNQNFGDLFNVWQESLGESEPDWLDSVCSQIEAFARKRYPRLRETRLTEALGNSSMIPVVTQLLNFPTSKEMEFDVQFYDMQPKSPCISEVMIGMNRVYSKSAEPEESSALSLKELYTDMKRNRINRLPVLDRNNHARYMVHRSVITEFLLDTDINRPKLKDLLELPELQETLTDTIAFVSASSSVLEAKEALQKVDGARDVFVTSDGSHDAPLLGLATNTDLEKYL